MKNKHIFLPILISFIIFFSINVLMVSSLAPQLLFKQLIAWGIGISLFFVGQQIIPRQLANAKWFLFIGSCLLLLLPILMKNITRGSNRWLYIGTATIQPSEVVKPWLMIFLATSNLPFLHLIPTLIIALQPDLGSAMSVFFLAIPVIFYNRNFLRASIATMLVFLLFIPLIWRFGLRDYQKHRIVTFLNPASDPLNKGYNVIQSKIAIGSGGFWGKGYKKGTQGQLLFLPEKHTDFIFAATAEELGFLGVIIILFAYYLLIHTLFTKAYQTSDLPLFLFTLGFAFQIWIQMFINIGMNIGLLPVTGIPLPFLSVGGSSIISYLLSLGIIFSH